MRQKQNSSLGGANTLKYYKGKTSVTSPVVIAAFAAYYSIKAVASVFRIAAAAASLVKIDLGRPFLLLTSEALPPFAELAWPFEDAALVVVLTVLDSLTLVSAGAVAD